MEKRFVSEKQLAVIAEQRKKDKPEEEEAPYDPRSLYDRLKEQKDKKQAEHDAQFAFKNQVSSITEDEASFLDEVAKRQMEEERRREAEDKLLIDAYHRAVRSKPSADSAGDRAEANSRQLTVSAGVGQRTSSQKSLLSKVVSVKRKPDTGGAADTQASSAKKSRDSLPATKAKEKEASKESPKESAEASKVSAAALLAEYGSDSDSG